MATVKTKTRDGTKVVTKFNRSPIQAIMPRVEAKLDKTEMAVTTKTLMLRNATPNRRRDKPMRSGKKAKFNLS